jgi:uncharacterized protein (DUF433 family)
MQLPDFLTEDPDGYIHVTGRRIGLQTLVYYYNDGYSPEMLFCEYPTLSLATIHKVIAFYLENRDEVDDYISRCRQEMEALIQATPRKGPGIVELRERMAKRKQLKEG